MAKGKRKTNEEFSKEVFDLVGNEYVFLEKYINNRTKLKCKHNIEECGYEWSIVPDSFLRGTRCPECAKKILSKMYTKTNEKFIQEVYELVGNDYIFLEDYINDKTKIKCKHNVPECGHTWNVVPSSFLQGKGCPECKGKKISESKTWTDSRFRQEVYKLVEDEYTFLEEYVSSRTKILCRHNICGHEYEVTPNHFFNGTRCPQCNKPDYKNNQELFIQKVQDLVGNEYVFLEEYISNQTKIKCRHNICGHEWDVQPNNFFNGTRCPRCIESKGEQTIRKYLEDNKISFKDQYTYDGLVGIGGGLLKFDFAIFNNKKLEFLVEYDGEFHYKDINEDGSLKIQQIHDKRKNQYCKDNDILLLRIPYWEFDYIDDLLEEWLVKYNIDLNKEKIA